jgi:hypothetical protein
MPLSQLMKRGHLNMAQADQLRTKILAEMNAQDQEQAVG